MGSAFPVASLLFIFLTAQAHAGVAQTRKTLHQLDAEANLTPRTLNDDAPVAVARVVNTGRVQDFIDSDNVPMEVVYGPAVGLIDQGLSQAILALDNSSELHHFEDVLNYLDVRTHFNTISFLSNSVAYAHLLYLTSRSHRFLLETIQFLAYVVFPTLPLIQFLNNTLKASSQGLRCSGQDKVRSYLAGVSGQYVFRSDGQPLSVIRRRMRITEVPPRDVQRKPEERVSFTWSGHSLLAVLNILASLLTLRAYGNLPTRSEWDVAAIGRDNRSGWLALSGTISALLSLLVQLNASAWSLCPPYSPGEATTLLWEGQIFTEIVLAALLQDLGAAYTGAVSMLGIVSILMANRLVLVVLFIAIALFSRHLRFVASELVEPRKHPHSMRPATVIFSLSICICIVIFQLCTALLERMALRDEVLVAHDRFL